MPFFAFLFLMLGLSQTSFACEVAGADLWFTESVTFDSKTLPSGITISSRPQKDGVRVLIVNTTPRPLVLARKRDDSENGFPHRGVPKNFDHKFLFKNSKVFQYDHAVAWVDGGASGNRVGTDKEIQESAVWQPIENREFAFGDISESKTMNRAEDGRPAGVKPPPAHDIILMLFYEGRPLAIKGRMSYALNMKYDPHAAQKNRDACREQ